MPQHRTLREEGFTLMETLVAMFIMAIGMLGVAALMGQMSDTSVQSRYMSTEALLASEKLEDLNRYGSGDAALTDGGGLAADVAQFSDQIQVSSGKDVSATGDIVEISQGSDAGGSYFWQVRHNPNGTADSTKTYGAPPAATADMVTFDRRWLIEKDQPVLGVRRITVLVTSAVAMQGLGKQQSFQMSMVKQCSTTPCP